MKIFAFRRKTDLDYADQAGDQESAGDLAAREWTGPADSITRGVSWLVRGALVLGVIGGLSTLSSCLGPSDHTQTINVEGLATQNASTQAAVGQFAEQFVTTWLTTPANQARNLSAYIQGGENASLPNTPWHVSDPAVALLNHTNGIWTPTVAVTVSSRAGAPGTRRYFTVPVYVDSQGELTAVAFPAPSPAPAQAKTPALGYVDRAQDGQPLFTLAQNFLTAYLVGGNLTPLTSPGSSLVAVAPAPYTGVEVTDVLSDQHLAGIKQSSPTDGTRLQLLVTADALASHGKRLSVEYALTTTARAGRWEITSVNPAPAVAPTSSDGSTN